MAERRKDNKGKVLHKGEGQRKDGRYQYRYTDTGGVRRTVYANDLPTLRAKEKQIEADRRDGLDYNGGKMTTKELVEKYLSLKVKLSTNTRSTYMNSLSHIVKFGLGARPIREVSGIMLREWIIRLDEAGYSFLTISADYRLVHSAFVLAVDSDFVRKNPANFRLSDVIENNSKKRAALTPEQQSSWLAFLEKNPGGVKNFYEMNVVLLGTGLRIGEMLGLTINDVNFERMEISVDHQLTRVCGDHCEQHITAPKTSSGIRTIPMTTAVANALRSVINRNKKDKTAAFLDGMTGFIFTCRKGRPCTHSAVNVAFKKMVGEYRRCVPGGADFPNISCHCLRHTYCSNLINAKMSVKGVQYLMGHASASVTMDIYAHADYESVKDEFFKAIGG